MTIWHEIKVHRSTTERRVPLGFSSDPVRDREGPQRASISNGVDKIPRYVVSSF